LNWPLSPCGIACSRLGSRRHERARSPTSCSRNC
jgi:hypothetical protein